MSDKTEFKPVFKGYMKIFCTMTTTQKPLSEQSSAANGLSQSADGL